MNDDIELISFRICPFVARALIVAREKKLDLPVHFISLKDKPAWFVDLSPTGNVPALRVGKRIVFESSVIAEYIDESTPGTLAPENPLRRAELRAWTEFCSRLLLRQYEQMCATTSQAMEASFKFLLSDLESVERRIEAAPYFDGHTFRIIDAAYAPLFWRLERFCRFTPSLSTAHLTRLGRWQAAVLERDSVKTYFDREFEAALVKHMREKGAHLATLLQ